MLKLYRGDVSELQFWTFGLPHPCSTTRLTAAHGSRLFPQGPPRREAAQGQPRLPAAAPSRGSPGLAELREPGQSRREPAAGNSGVAAGPWHPPGSRQAGAGREPRSPWRPRPAPVLPAVVVPWKYAPWGACRALNIKDTTSTVHSYFIEILEKASNGKISLL